LATSSCRPGYEWDGGMEPKNSARSLKPRSSAPCRTTAVGLTDLRMRIKGDGNSDPEPSWLRRARHDQWHFDD
jgi:hypothetical protein